MLADAGASKSLVKDAREIESAPGGSELLYTVAAEEMMGAMGIPKKDAKKVRLYEIGGYVEKQRGGSVHSAAQRTRRAGRGDDSIMLHMSPEEAEVISAMWGPPEVNPKTGIGEYGFLSKVWKKLKKGVKKIVKSQAFQIIAPIALAIFVPGLGAAIGGALLGAGASATATAMVGQAVIGAGLGAMSGGKEGALKGAIAGGISGGAGSALGKSVGLTGKTADVVGSAMLSGTGAELTGGDFTTGAITGGLGAATRGSQEAMAESARGAMGMEAKEGAMFASRIDPNAPAADFGSYTKPATVDDIMGGAAEFDAELGAYKPVETPYTEADYALQQETGVPGALAPAPAAGAPAAGGPKDDFLMKYGLPALTALGSMQGSYGEGEPPELPSEFRENVLPTYQMDRKFQGLPGGEGDYYTYGQAGAPQSGQHLFITPADPFPGEREADAAAGISGGVSGAEIPSPGARGADPAAGGDRVQIQYGRRGLQQREQLEAQGWSDGGDGYYYPPQQQAGFTGARGGLAAALGGYWEQTEDVFNAAPGVSASGGYTKGPGSGRSDDIEARLSDGEYVIDAESVSLLGDGSGDEGARRLDEMRTNLRKHKGKNFKKGEFSHKAKPPAKYMSNVRKLRRKAQYEHGGLHNVAQGGTI
jgi:hypothetical protein